MITRLTEKKQFVNILLVLLALFAMYLLVAWVSYSPLDNAWSVASSATDNVLNKTGWFGAWLIDLLYALFGKLTILVPLSLCIVVATQFFSKNHRLQITKVSAAVGSFMLLMCGLSIAVNYLVPNDLYYLSGGTVGAMLSQWLAGWIGQFGALLCAVLLTGIGFYFCSGQQLLQRVQQFYQWLNDRPIKGQAVELSLENEAKPEEDSETHSDIEEKAPLEKAASDFVVRENIDSPGLTDPLAFSRPKITGLSPQPADVHSQSVSEDIPLSTSGFQVRSDVVLPSVIVPTMPTEVAEIPALSRDEVDIAPLVSPSSAVKMPKVILTPKASLDDVPAFVAKPSETVIAEVQAKPQSVPTEKLFTAQPSISAPEPKIEVKASVAEIGIEIEPVIVPDSAQTVEKRETVYPKGYGNSLIHPLLQPKTMMEKPTTPLPTLDLLDTPPVSHQQITEQEIRQTSMNIEKELANFGVKATVEDVLVGPVVTRYEIKPAAGVKAAKITALDSDLARALMFKAIRITDVIPGKPFMGIETPNTYRQTVWLRDVLASGAFQHSNATLPMALGKDISGEPVIVDMAKMPHLLVAGQTGGGKSVGVNTMILSLLFKLTPEQVRFIMIDPKVVELSIYNDIPHLLTPVVTDMKKAANALRWAVEEMERRYQLVSHLVVRNIEGYNNKIDQAAEMNFPIPNPIWRPGDTMDSLPPPLEKLPYIVLIVDEFADLMMSAGKQVEEYIMRIAQKARAVGIHLILATQRPSTDVITGVIKANIPSRIAFTVSSQIDSRTILDKGGAESLLGRGDMLYSGASSPEIIRVHGAFMSDEEVQRVADNWRARGKPNYLENITASKESDEGENGGESSNDLDPLFDEVANFVIETNTTSISGIQRRFSLGFNRAGRIVDQLEEQGILSPAERGKREVLAR